MTRAEALKIATFLRTAYQNLKGCAEGRDERTKGKRYILIDDPFMPSPEEIKGLSDFILENEDRTLFNRTFGMMDEDLLNHIWWKLDEIAIKWDGKTKYNLLIGNKMEVRDIHKNDFMYIVGVYDTKKAVRTISGIILILNPIFKNLIPPQEASPTPQPDTSTPVITNLVIEPSTGATAPEDWRLPMELDIDRAREYFKRCIDEGWLTITSIGGEWKLQAVRLGYVCNRIYKQPRPLTALIKFFNNPNLKAQITQADYEAKTIKVKKWREEIDSKIFFD